MAGGSVIWTYRAARSKASPPRPPFRPCTDRFEARNRTSSRHTTRPGFVPPLPLSRQVLVFLLLFSQLLLCCRGGSPAKTSLLEQTPFLFLDFRPRNRTREPRGGANRIGWVVTAFLGGKYRRPCDSLPSREQRAHQEKKTCASK